MIIARRAWQSRAGVCSTRWFSPIAASSLSPAPDNSDSVNFVPIRRFVGAHFASFRTSDDLSLSRIVCYVKRRYFATRVAADLADGEMVDVPLAQTGEGIAECELLKWFVKEGDEVDEFQPLCEVQSDKATIEITSRYKGRVAQTLYIPGDIVKVGETLLKIIVEEFQTREQPGESVECLGDAKAIDFEQNKQNISGVLSTPVVRDLAKQYGIDINDIVGTGKEGRVTKYDIAKYAVENSIIEDTLVSSTKKTEYDHCSPVVGQKNDDEVVSLRGFQRKMVQTMTMAAKVPHFHYVEDINCDALVKVKQSFQNDNLDQSVKYTFLPILMKSLSMAMSRFPFLNSCFNENSLEVILKGSHNIGVAMATQHGLVVPNIKNVQSLSIFEITKELSRLQQLALDNKLAPGDISGGTITLSNIGSIGGKFGSPLLNLPEVSIIALGRILKVPRFSEDGNIYPASIMTINIGADHRVLDGATVARFCREWKKLIENPDLLVMHLR